MVEDLESMMEAHSAEAEGRKIITQSLDMANAKRIAELKKRVEKVESVLADIEKYIEVQFGHTATGFIKKLGLEDVPF